MADDTTSLDSYAPPKLSSTQSSLRILSIVTFIPAFPLSVAHGVLSNHSVPAVGLVPLAFSASGAIFLLRRQASASDDESGPGAATRLAHPVLVFVCDVLLAAALMVVLVFTWISPGGNPSLSMLAAYATIPLLVNFCIHFVLALESFYTGLAIHGLVQWLAWRTLPPDCPHCNHRLRPPFPELPWVERVRERGDDYTALFVDDEHRYRDEEEGEEPANVLDHEDGVTGPLPVPVEVRKKKDRKGKSTPTSEDSPTPWGAQFGGGNRDASLDV